MDAPVQLVFSGEVLEGFSLDDVKRRVGQLLKLDDARVAQLFSGRRTVLKRAVAREDADRYARVLAQAGARVLIEAEPAPTRPAPSRADAPAGGKAEMSMLGNVERTAPSPASARPAAPVLELVPAAAPAVDEVTCPNCGERQTKRLLCRGCATNLEMAIAAKIERDNAARQARQDELDARRAMRAGAATGTRAPGIFGFGLSGRMGRLKYATAHAAMWSLLMFLAVPAIEKPTGGRVAFFMLGVLLVAFLSMRHSVLRCHDCDKSGWWTLFTFVPTANLILSLILSFAPGTDGENDYGEQPPSSGWAPLGISVIVLCIAAGFLVKATIHAMTMQGVHIQNDEESQELGAGSDHRADAMLPNEEARDAFSRYQQARDHKAFAVSAAGGWGMATSAGNARDAMKQALADCETRRPQYTGECAVINLNGMWPRR